MADKKITELTELTEPSSDDLLLVIDNPSGTPITKKITVANFVGNVSYVTSTTVVSGIAVRSTMTSNAVASGSMVIAAGKFLTNATGVSTATPYQYGLWAVNQMASASANVKIENAAAKFTLDVGNAGSLITNTYGIIVHMANNASAARAVQPQAFISLAEDTSGSTSTKYLLDIGQNGLANVSANVSVANGNVTTVLSKVNATTTYINSTASVITHKLRVRINGEDFFMLLANSSAAGL